MTGFPETGSRWRNVHTGNEATVLSTGHRPPDIPENAPFPDIGRRVWLDDLPHHGWLLGDFTACWREAA